MAPASWSASVELVAHAAAASERGATDRIREMKLFSLFLLTQTLRILDLNKYIEPI